MGRQHHLVTAMRCAGAILLGLTGAWGHGSMYSPSPWWATSDCSPNEQKFVDCKFGLSVPKPELKEDRCFKDETTNGCSRSGGRNAWFTNFTRVPEVTIDKEFIDGGLKGDDVTGYNPWTSPGAAPVYGNGCGLNGGNPEGCDGEDATFGRCCGGGDAGMGCGGYVGGKPALDHYKDGLFGDPRITTWTRGQPAEVFWASGANHMGGYAYRLCKVNNGKFWKVTEKCFNKGHLNFYGDTTWIDMDARRGEMTENTWEARELVTTTEGTTPEGSMWAKLTIGRPSKGQYFAFKDLVEVPEDLEAGEYVLSFRWDSLHTPQVWNACSNILVQ